MRAHETRLATRPRNDETSYVTSASERSYLAAKIKYRKLICATFYTEKFNLLLVVYTVLL
jgi:hypothetical protein